MENLQPTITNLKPNVSLHLVALGAVVLLAVFLWMEHNAHLRSEGALKEIQRQTEAEVSALRSQADSAAHDANQSNARASSQLLATRRLLQRQSQELGEKLAGLAVDEKTRVQELAALPAPEIWKRLNAQLGEGTVVSRESGEERSESRNQKSEKDSPSHPEGGPSHQLSPPPPGGQSLTEDGSSSIANVSAVAALPSRLDHKSPIINNANPGVALTETGARQVETALVELDFCRQQSEVQSAQMGTCRKEAAAEAAMVEQQKSSIAQLNLALGDKDQILAKRETEFKAEIKAARGTWMSRFTHTAEHVAIGVAIGFAIR